MELCVSFPSEASAISRFSRDCASLQSFVLRDGGSAPVDNEMCMPRLAAFCESHFAESPTPICVSWSTLLCSWQAALLDSSCLARHTRAAVDNSLVRFDKARSAGPAHFQVLAWAGANLHLDKPKQRIHAQSCLSRQELEYFAMNKSHGCSRINKRSLC